MERWQRVSVYSTLALAGALISLAACGGNGAGPASPTPTEESRTVTSDDGKLTLEIPPGALDEDDVEITITSVPLEGLPEELQVVQGAGDGYRLEPDGLQFSKPVAVSLELERDELEDEPEDGITAYALVSLTEDGERDLLDKLVTEATLGEETVVARGELSHFSWITRTKGSLVVSLEEVSRDQPVGGTFTAEGRVGNGDLTDTVTLENPSGTFLAFGTVSTSGDTTFDSDAELSPGDVVKGTGTFQCGQSPGLGTYTVRGTATSVVVVDNERRETPLTVTVDGVIDCVAPTTPTPAPTPTTTEEPAAQQVLLAQAPGCEHTMPGVQSELLDRVFLLFGVTPPERATVEASAEGPGLLESTASGVTDANGQVLLTFPIDAFGPYGITVDQVIGPDGNVLEIAPGSQTKVTFEVGEVCTQPGHVSAGDVICSQDLGDVNGDGSVDSIDAALILQFDAGLIESLPCQGVADANGDGNINAIDASLILQLEAGLIDSLP